MAHAVARLVAAAVTTGVVALAGCAQPETIRSYTPANGANVDQGDVKARALAIVADGDKGLLSGAIVSAAADRLVGMSAQAIDATGEHMSPLQVQDHEVALPAGRLVELPGQEFLVDGDGLVPGLTAQLVLTFEKAGTATVVVPVVSATDPDWATMTPRPGQVTPSASASPSPATTASPGESPSAETTAPSASPSPSR